MENIVVKEEIARFEQFLLLTVCFQKPSAAEASERVFMRVELILYTLQTWRLISHLILYTLKTGILISHLILYTLQTGRLISHLILYTL